MKRQLIQTRITEQAYKEVQKQTIENINWMGDFVSQCIMIAKKSGYNFIVEKQKEQEK